MIRCPECGRRLSEARPSCPEHGAPEQEPAAEPSREPPIPQLDTKVRTAFLGLGYEVSRLLGSGGFGTVYEAIRQRDKLPVAIKVAQRERADGAERLQREVRALELIGPPHVPAVYDRGALLGQFYVVLEYIRTPTLADYLVDCPRPLPLPTFAKVAAAILRAVEAVHGHGVVHRDLKPENIFYDEQSGQARVIDFGLARERRAQPASIAPTEDDVGSAEYMSPEQCDGLNDADRRSDIYSIGVLLYELISGAPPFWGKTADVREAHRSRRPLPLSVGGACSAELDHVIRRCLAKDRARRFEDVASLRGALEVALSSPRAVQSSSSSQVLAAITALSGETRPTQTTAAREKRTVGLVFFETRAGLGAVQPVLTASGGQIVQTNGSQYVAAFGHDVGDNPARIALMAARRLLAAKLSARLLVDVAAVSVQLRPDGSRRVFSPVFTKKDRFPASTDPAGVLLTGAAIEVLPHLKVSPADGRPDRFMLDLSPAPAEPTTFGVQLAPLVGRDELLHEITEGARGALVRSEPTLITVSAAEAGYGRSHLAGVVAQRVERLVPSAIVLRLASQEGIVGAMSQTLPELLRRVLDLPGETPSDGGHALLVEALGAPIGEQVWPAAALLLGWIDAEHPAVRRLSAAPGALRLAAARAAGEALRLRARHKPLAIVLDDAHLADDATLDALEYATLAEASACIWVCALVRASFARARPTWGTRAQRAQTMPLRPLAPAHAAELARRLLLPAEHVPPAALARLAERTEGVPRLLVELVRGLKRDGLVRRSERGIGYYLATDELEKLPDLPIVQWNASREVEALPAQLAGHARLSSVLGSAFTTAEVEALLSTLEMEGLPDDMQLDASVGIQRLVDASILVRHRSGTLDFRHALLRDTIYQLVPDEQRKRLHGAAYSMYRAFPMPHEHRLPRIALHAARSGQREAAASAYLELAQRAARTHAYLEAEAAYGGALENLPTDDPARTVDALRGRGLMRFRLGRHEDALKDLRQARERAGALSDPQRERELRLDEATVLDWTRDFAQSAELVRTVAEGGVDDSRLLSARLSLGLARVHHRRGEAESCVQLSARAAELAEALGDDAYETRIISLMMAAPDCANLGRLEEAERYFDQAIASAESHGDMLHLGGAHLNRILLWYARKDVDRLFRDLSRATQVAREIGSALLEYTTFVNRGEVEYALEELARASEHTMRARELAEKLWGEDSREVGTRDLLLARIALYRGDLPQARMLTERIRARRAAQRAHGDIESEFMPADEMVLEMVELGARNASDAEWDALAARARAAELQPLEEVELIECRALSALRTGHLDQARRLLEGALALARQKPNLMSERVARKLAAL